MKLPKSVQVGPCRYGVVSVPLPDDRWGQCKHTEREIRLADDCSPERQALTFMHEIIHAVDIVFVVGLKERQVEALCHGLAQALGGMGAWPEKFE